MISRIKGEVAYIGEGFLEILCGSVGYKIYCPPKVLGIFAQGQEAELFTHLAVREDAHTLYGFNTREERDFFEILISISGIGPRGALGVLSASPLDLLKKAIASGDTSVLTRVSGIGQKIASRIILELKDKMGNFAAMEGGDLREGGDLIDALVGLGYTRSQAQEALRKIPEDMKGLENKVKEALKILGK